MGLHCLVVDDAPAIRYAARMALERQRSVRMRVEEAGDIQEAQAVVAAGVPDVVLLDIVLDGPDGDAATRFGQDLLQRHPAIGIIVFTSLPREDSRVDALISLGARAHLRKPVHPSQVARTVLDVAMERTGLQRIA